MSTKLFKESDSWGDSSGHSGDVNWSFKKTPKVKKNKKNKEAKKRSHSETEDDPNAGKFVRAPKFYGLEDSDGTPKESPSKIKRNKRKRKLEENNINNEQSSDGITPEKKLKPNNVPAAAVEVVKDQPTTFGDQLRESLKGSRFRFLNEQMYKQSGKESMEIFKEDETAFTAYHEGYRHQVLQWPMNPLDRIINNMKRLPKNHVIVDMGCGDARLSKTVTQKVYSIDLVSSVEGVIESDMAKTPLEKGSAHVVVYCLSLMGTNLKDFFIEANRILKMNGIVKIAEVSSRFEDIQVFVDFVQKCGFELVSKDLTHNLFYFINFKKTHDVNSFNKKIPDYSLKPCLYKKR